MCSEQRARPIRLGAALVWAGEHPVFRPIVGSLQPPVPHLLPQVRIERYGFLRGLRLAGPHLLLDHRAGDVDLELLEIYIRPLETEQFSDSQAGGYIQE